MKKIAWAFIMGGLIMGCKSQKETNPEQNSVAVVTKDEMGDNLMINPKEFEGTYSVFWMEGAPESEEIRPYLTIKEDGKIGGNNGCNSFFGRINEKKSETLFGKLGATRMMCDGEKFDIEKMFMELLAQVVSVENNGDEIYFSKDNHVVMKAKKIELSGNFRVTSLGSEKLNESTFDFSIEGRTLVGNTGCNSFTCQVVQGGYQIEILEVSATEMACEEFDSRLEAGFFISLAEIDRFSVLGIEYTFYTGKEERFTAIKE